jgi:hypothetical protein
VRPAGSPTSIVTPAYGAASLAELLPSVASALGVPGQPNRLGLPSGGRYVVLLVDGLGERLLRAHAASAPYLAGLLGSGLTLTTPVPSTTATSLTSLGTGLPPGAHGVVGFTQRIPGTGRLLNTLKWSSTVDPLRWQPHDTVFEEAQAAGVAVSVVNQRGFRGSGLTVASSRGGAYVGADTVGERIAEVAFAAQAPRSLTYAYEPDLDKTGHQRGCRSPAWTEQLGVVDDFVARLRRQIPADACLLVTGDHGMVDVGREARLDVDTEPDLLDGVTLIGGEARFRHLYCNQGAAGEVAARWRERLGRRAVVLESAEAIERGWFGPVEPAVLPRIGDVLVACLTEVAVESSSRFPLELRLIGLHGSVTEDEMLVPLLIDAGHS